MASPMVFTRFLHGIITDVSISKLSFGEFNMFEVWFKYPLKLRFAVGAELEQALL